MKYYKIIVFAAWAVLMMCCQHQAGRKSFLKIENILPPENLSTTGMTPMREQKRQELSWIYGMLSTIESEHIMKGDSIHLSTAYITRMILQERALEYYFSEGKKHISLKGTCAMLVGYLQKYGAVPYDSYVEGKDVNYDVLCRKIEKICDVGIRQKTGLKMLREKLDALFDDEIGVMPAKQVHMLGAEYTPLEFAHSVCYPEEYVALTSFTHHPFRDYFSLEIPENEGKGVFLNLPLQEMVNHLKVAVGNGHPVCWEGDLDGLALLENGGCGIDVASGHPVDQALRQTEFERLETKDNQVLEIIGMFPYNGKTYFVCRNSMGQEWGDHGFVYLSDDYIKLKTLAIYMSEEAFLLAKS